jgi:hypothetical protein
MCPWNSLKPGGSLWMLICSPAEEGVVSVKVDEIVAEIRQLLESQVRAAKDVSSISSMTESDWSDYQARDERIKALFKELDSAREDVQRESWQSI